MKICELKEILTPQFGVFQEAILWNSTSITNPIIVDSCSIEYILEKFPEKECKKIHAVDNKLIIEI